MELLGATVSKAPRQVKTKYGDRLVCDVRLQDGSETAIWGPVNYAPLEYLERGQAVTVSRDSKGKVSIIAPTLPKENGSGMSAELKKTIAQYVTEQRDLLAFCLDQAATIPQAQTDESVEKLGVTLFIAAQRKFKLA